MSGDEDTTVGVVGEASDAFADAVAEAITDAGGDLVTGSTDDVLAAEPSVVLAVGEAAFIDVATSVPEFPILPVDAGRGVRSLPGDALPDVAGRVVAGEWTTESHPLLSVTVDGDGRGSGVVDVALVTAEAAHISEYDLAASGVRLDCVRADGVVVATPAGSTGYAQRLDAPILAPGSGAVVVPIAPFATDPDSWVVDPDGLTLELVREEPPVELIVDGAVACTVDPSETVSITVDEVVETAVLPESRSRYD